MGLLNPSGSVDVPTSLFLGLNTEVNPIDLPEGQSPDCQDVIFVPGSVASRPCLHGILSPRLAGSPTITYQKTFVQANGQPLTLFLDSLGNLWKEDVANNPGVAVSIGSVTPGSYCTSVTANNREWMAFHDGLHGTDIPRQFDGVNFDRITQDGPGAGPSSITDNNVQVAVSSVAIGNLGGGIATATEAGLSVTITTNAAHGLTEVGGFVLIAGVSVAGYNGVYQIQAIPSTTTFITTNAGSGLGNGNGGTLGLATVTVVTSTAHGLQVGDAVILSGTGSTFNNGTNQTSNTPVPLFWDVVQVTNATTFLFSLVGLRGQGALNTTTINGSGAGGNAQIGGMISVGTHQLCVSFQLRSGYITAPSPIVSWTCAGNKSATVTNVPIGPANTVARILSLTGAGGANFFYIPASARIPGSSLLFNGGLAPPTIVAATIIPDNVTTTFVLDFPDNTLFAGQPIDVTGNNLFAQVVLGPCLGFTYYASRLISWGERNKIQQFLNMGFEGGFYSASPAAPLGWTQADAHSALVANPAKFGEALKITGTGGGGNIGLISQPAYQDANFVPILLPNTAYTFRFWAIASAAGLPGNLVAEIFSPSSGSLATATVSIATIGNAGLFFQQNFTAAMPAVIPIDTIIRFYATGQNLNDTVTIDELEIIYKTVPFIDTFARVSYISPPASLESFDINTGKIGATEDTSPIRGFAQMRKNLYLGTASGIHSTRDNGTTEPNQWEVAEVSRTVGPISSKMFDAGKFGTGDTGEEWLVIGSYGGAYIFGGGPLFKISQENQPIWDRINKAAMQTACLKNDPTTRRVYFALPLDTATAPNVVYPMDYREMDTDAQIAAGAPIHISFSGKMIASDLARKWAKWNVQTNCIEIIQRPGGVQQLCFGAGNGVTPGGMAGFGQFYFLDPTKLTDDDYGQINPYWTSYFFVNHDQEQALQLGGYRKTFEYSAYYISGVGTFTVTPYRGSLSNPWNASIARTLNATQLNDVEIPLNIPSSRVAFKIASQPLQGQTDNSFNLQKMIVSIRKNYISPVRGAK